MRRRPRHQQSRQFAALFWCVAHPWCGALWRSVGTARSGLAMSRGYDLPPAGAGGGCHTCTAASSLLSFSALPTLSPLLHRGRTSAGPNRCQVSGASRLPHGGCEVERDADLGQPDVQHGITVEDLDLAVTQVEEVGRGDVGPRPVRGERAGGRRIRAVDLLLKTPSSVKESRQPLSPGRRLRPPVTPRGRSPRRSP